MNTMTTTPAAGTYLVDFGTWITENTNSSQVTISVFVGGTEQLETRRTWGPSSNGSDIGVTSIATVATVNGAQAIEVRWRVSAGTATATHRTLRTVRIK
jgi:hypothetical protein